MTLELVHGLFNLQDSDFEWTEPGSSFQLKATSSDRWTRLKETIDELKKDGPVKVVWLARHGQGVHNLAAQKYGEKAFWDHYGRLYSDEELVWAPDPLLTAKGEAEARAASHLWATQTKEGMPTPTSFYTSPLTRAASTLRITFEHTNLLTKYPPTFIEDLREGINLAQPQQWKLENVEPWQANYTAKTCFTDHQRSSKAVLSARFPGWRFEDGFEEEDLRWRSDYVESADEHAARTKAFFERLFREDQSTCAL